MKIGVNSYSFSQWMRQTGADYCAMCDKAKELGFEGIELVDLSLKVQPAEDLTALARTIRAHCERIELPIAAYTIRADFLDNPEEVQRLRGQVDLAAELGAPLMRHDITWRRDVPWREIIRTTQERIRDVAAYAQTRGVKTCTENHGFVMQDAERMETLMRAVDHPNYGWLVDIGNFLCADEPPIHAMPIAAPYAVHVHAKDFLLKSESPGDDSWFETRGGQWLRGTVLGHGVVPVRRCIAELKAAGYDGWISVEFEGMEQNLPALRASRDYLGRAAAQA